VTAQADALMGVFGFKRVEEKAMDKVNETRRAKFEVWARSNDFALCRLKDGGYSNAMAFWSWIAFNAALDAVEIELPDEGDISASDSPWDMRRDCRAAIESTNLGLRIK
jgi:hypothetical protein